METRTYGYARVSTHDQDAGRQVQSLLQHVEERYILVDKSSGTNTERPNYQLLKQILRAGDVLYIHELDRLGRTKKIIKQELEWFNSNKIRVKILNIPTSLIDVPTGQEWVLDMVNNILLEVLSTIAEEEMHTRNKRQREGIAYARKKGKHLGRPFITVDSHQFETVYNDWKRNKITAVTAMNILNLRKTTFYNKVKAYEISKQK